MKGHKVERPSGSQIWAAVDWLRSYEAGDGDPLGRELRAVAEWLAVEEVKRTAKITERQ